MRNATNKTFEGTCLVSTSILGANWLAFGDAISLAERAGTDLFQIDVADGHFTPTITFGEELVRSVRKVTAAPIEVHLMISDPYPWLPVMAEMGADFVIFHVEAVNRLQATITHARNLGLGVGLALNSETRPEDLEFVLAYVDLITLMAILPGFAGQPFIPETFTKITQLRRMLDQFGEKRPLIEVDGGVKTANIEQVILSGADIVVVSSAIYQAADPLSAIDGLKHAAGNQTDEKSRTYARYFSAIQERRAHRATANTSPTHAK
jgi:ribulose-phosphate 3-epimerase